MVVTLADIATQLQGVRNGTNTGYVLYRYYDVLDTTIQEYIDQCTAYCTEQIDAATITASPALFDYFVQNYVCWRLLGEHVMGMVMAVGFSWEDLETRIDRKNYPEVIGKAAEQYQQRVKEFFLLLRERVVLFSFAEYNVDPYYIWENNYRSTAAWGRGL